MKMSKGCYFWLGREKGEALLRGEKSPEKEEEELELKLETSSEAA